MPKMILGGISKNKYILQHEYNHAPNLGEASAIALAAESQQPSLLIIDDMKDRKLAQKLNLTITGTLGLILAAKREGILPQIE